MLELTADNLKLKMNKTAGTSRFEPLQNYTHEWAASDRKNRILEHILLRTPV